MIALAAFVAWAGTVQAAHTLYPGLQKPALEVQAAQSVTTTTSAAENGEEQANPLFLSGYQHYSRDRYQNACEDSMD